MFWLLNRLERFTRCQSHRAFYIYILKQKQLDLLQFLEVFQLLYELQFSSDKRRNVFKKIKSICFVLINYSYSCSSAPGIWRKMMLHPNIFKYTDIHHAQVKDFFQTLITSRKNVCQHLRENSKLDAAVKSFKIVPIWGFPSSFMQHCEDASKLRIS